MDDIKQRAELLKQRISIVDVFEAMGERFEGGARAKWRRGTVMSSLVVNTHANTWARYKYPDQHGDVFDLIMLTEGVSFPEAVKMVDEGRIGCLRSLPGVEHAIPLIVKPPPQPTVELPGDLHLRYHRGLDAFARDWWHQQGADDEMISRFWLGVCEYHEIWRQPTYTIPVIVDKRLVNIRHRLAFPPATGDKYRPERVGLGTELFNSDILIPDQHGVIIVAGEKKVIVMARFGLPAISSTAGCGYWNDEWTTRLQFCRKVYIAFDPGEGEAAEKLAERIGERAFLVDVPEKPDDWLLRVERESSTVAATQQFRNLLRAARPHVNADIWRNRNGGSTWHKVRNLPK